MFVRARRLVVTTALAGLAVGLVGCGGGSGDKPRILPPLSTTPAATASALPAGGGKKAELAAATAVVREYLRLLNNLDHDMSAANFARIETPTCPCRKFLKSLRSVQSRGNHYFGHAFVRAAVPAADSQKFVEVLVNYDSRPGGIADSHNHVIEQSPGLKGVTELFYVRRVTGRWLVDKIAVIHHGRPQ